MEFLNKKLFFETLIQKCEQQPQAGYFNHWAMIIFNQINWHKQFNKTYRLPSCNNSNLVGFFKYKSWFSEVPKVLLIWVSYIYISCLCFLLQIIPDPKESQKYFSKQNNWGHDLRVLMSMLWRWSAACGWGFL